LKVYNIVVSSSLGAAVAQLLVSRGHKVWEVARRGSLMAQLGERLHNPQLNLQVADICIQKNLRRVERVVRESDCQLDVIVLKAG
jgi:NADP-dependent 3-hydroxy acid dehydrogenase YdfG